MRTYTNNDTFNIELSLDTVKNMFKRITGHEPTDDQLDDLIYELDKSEYFFDKVFDALHSGVDAYVEYVGELTDAAYSGE